MANKFCATCHGILINKREHTTGTCGACAARNHMTAASSRYTALTGKVAPKPRTSSVFLRVSLRRKGGH